MNDRCSDTNMAARGSAKDTPPVEGAETLQLFPCPGATCSRPGVAHRRAGACGIWTVVCLAVAACVGGPGQEITTVKPYADVIGARYSVVGKDVYAYGVYESLNDRTVSYVTLIPRGGVGGPEFAFRRIVQQGQVIRIVSAWRQFPGMEGSVYYIVEVEDSDLPPDIPVRVQLSRGNEGVGAELNPDFYKRLPKDN